MYGVIGISASSLHRESTDSLIYRLSDYQVNLALNGADQLSTQWSGVSEICISDLYVIGQKVAIGLGKTTGVYTQQFKQPRDIWWVILSL